MSAAFDRPGAYDRHSLEFRWTIATGAALALCALGLVAATILLATGERFEYRPEVPALTQDDDGPTRLPQPPQTPETADECAGGTWPYFTSNCLWAPDVPKRRRIVQRLKSPWCSGVLRHQPFHSCRPRPR